MSLLGKMRQYEVLFDLVQNIAKKTEETGIPLS
jgi:hypothetical protein